MAVADEARYPRYTPTEPQEEWEEPPREWLGGYLHPGWANSWRRLVAAVRWLGGAVSWPVFGTALVGWFLVLVLVRAWPDDGAVPGSVPAVLSVVMALIGAGGVVFGALRFNREEAQTIIRTQQSVLDDMARFNDEVREALERERGR